MKKLIAPVIVALLVVITLAVATQYFVLPALIDYTEREGARLGEANAQLNALQLMHKTTPGGRFDEADFTEAEIKKSADELEDLVAAGQMTFDNPEIHTLMEELKRRLDEVRKREARVEQVQIELNLQWNHLAAVTNRIDQARQDLSNRLEVARKLIKDTEVKQLKVIAATLTNTEPDVAVITLRMETNVVESAKYLYFMENAERAKILTELNQGTPEDQKLANDIIQEFKNIGQDIPINPTE